MTVLTALMANPLWSFAQCSNPTTTDVTLTGGGTVTIFPYDAIGDYHKLIFQKSSTDYYITNNLSMGKFAEIVIEPGAHVIIQGTTITACDPSKPWSGIYVEGANASQLVLTPTDLIFNPDQGLLVIENNNQVPSRIEYANYGVWVGDEDLGAHMGDNEGGILRVANSIFYNCGTGIYFDTYSDPHDSARNVSFIRNTKFLWDDTAVGSGTVHNFSSQIYVSHTKGIILAGDTFENATPRSEWHGSSRSYTYRGIGVDIGEGSVLLCPSYPCFSDARPITGSQNCGLCIGADNTFLNLYQGIRVNVAPFNISQIAALSCHFTDCYEGIQLWPFPTPGKVISFINRCTFTADDQLDDYIDNPAVKGIDAKNIYTDGAGGTDISDNLFNFSYMAYDNPKGTACANDFAAGIEIDQTSSIGATSHARIYKDSFYFNMQDTFQYPVYAITAGYTSNCNTITKNDANTLDIDGNAFNITPYTTHTYYDIYYNALSLNRQGSSTTPARNKFLNNRTCSISNQHHIGFATGSAGMDYYYPPVSAFPSGQPVCNTTVSSFHTIVGGSYTPVPHSSWCRPFHSEEDTSTWQPIGHNNPYDNTDLTKPDLYIEIIDNIFEKDRETGIEQNDYTRQWVKSYPNPTSGFITFDVSALAGSDLSLMITDESGRQIIQKTIRKGIISYNVDLRTLKKGAYFYHISSCRLPEENGYGKIILK